MPGGYDGASATAAAKLLRFFTITDIHITDAQSPAQAILYGYKGFLSSAYSGVMMYTHHVLDAAVRTVNAMHERGADRLRHLAGRHLQQHPAQRAALVHRRPRRQAHRPRFGRQARRRGRRTRGDGSTHYEATGLDPSIPWYQARGNHDHFWTGFLSESTTTCVRTLCRRRRSSTSATSSRIRSGPTAAASTWAASTGARPTATSSAWGRSRTSRRRRRCWPPIPTAARLPRAQWMASSSRPRRARRATASSESSVADGFACYTFEPKADVPHQGHRARRHPATTTSPTTTATGTCSPRQGALRLARERAGQGPGRRQAHDHRRALPHRRGERRLSPMGWSSAAYVSEEELFAKLHTYPNLILWIAGHRHCNAVTAVPVAGRRPARARLLGGRDLVAAGLPAAVPHVRDRAQQRRYRVDHGDRRRPGRARTARRPRYRAPTASPPSRSSTTRSAFCPPAPTTPSSLWP